MSGRNRVVWRYPDEATPFGLLVGLLLVLDVPGSILPPRTAQAGQTVPDDASRNRSRNLSEAELEMEVERRAAVVVVAKKVIPSAGRGPGVVDRLEEVGYERERRVGRRTVLDLVHPS